MINNFKNEQVRNYKYLFKTKFIRKCYIQCPCLPLLDKKSCPQHL